MTRNEGETADGRELKGAAMRARLRAATEALIAEVGVNAASAAAIAQRCGVSRGAMLHHYPTRDDLMIDTAAHFWQRARDIVSALADDMIAGRTDVTTFVDRLYDEVFRANALVTMLDLMVTERGTRVGDAVNGILTDLFRSYEDLGVKAFEVSGVAPERIRVIITLIVSTLRGLRIQDNIHRDEARVREVLAMLVEAVGSLLEKEGGTAAAVPAEATPPAPRTKRPPANRAATKADPAKAAAKIGQTKIGRSNTDGARPAAAKATTTRATTTRATTTKASSAKPSPAKSSPAKPAAKAPASKTSAAKTTAAKTGRRTP